MNKILETKQINLEKTFEALRTLDEPKGSLCVTLDQPGLNYDNGQSWTELIPPTIRVTGKYHVDDAGLITPDGQVGLFTEYFARLGTPVPGVLWTFETFVSIENFGMFTSSGAILCNQNSDRWTTIYHFSRRFGVYNMPDENDGPFRYPLVRLDADINVVPPIGENNEYVFFSLGAGYAPPIGAGFLPTNTDCQFNVTLTRMF